MIENKKYLVSVIMPLYNHETYVEDAINSVLAQKTDDVELIIVNDCSTDRSEKIALDYSSKHPGVRVVYTNCNSGIGAARAKGVQFARGKYVAFLSSDDVWKPTFIKTMLSHVTENNIVFCDYEILTPTGGVQRTEKACAFTEPHTFEMNYFHTLCKKAAREHGMFVNYSSIIGLKKFFEGELAFPTELRYGEDLYHVLKASRRACFTYVPEALIRYRVHDGSVTSKKAGALRENNFRIIAKLKEEGEWDE